MTSAVSRSFAAALGLAAVATLSAASSHSAVAFPEGYRSWTHLSSTFIGADAPPAAMSEQGVHHIYGNAQAVEGLRTGHFADGARVVYDLIATTTTNGVTKEGARKRLDVMEKDSARYAASGGWGFESFVNGEPGTPRVGENGATMCWNCHQQRAAARGGVISAYRP